MTRILRDSTSLHDIPTAGTDLAGVYINGRFASSPTQVHARFPHTPAVWIDVNGTMPAADVLDVEAGDATPAGAVLWVKAKRLLQLPATHTLYPPVIYCNRATLTPLFNAMGAAGLHVGHDFRLWVATLDGTTHLADMTGVTAVQARGEAQTGGHYDESAVYDPAWKGPVPVPVPVSHPGAGPIRHTLGAGQTLAMVAASRNTTTAHLRAVTAAALTEADINQGKVYYTTH